MRIDSLSSSSRRRWHYAFRTAYALAINVVLMNLWAWAGAATYISLAVTILLTTMYLGQWQANAWKVLYASFYGTALGILCLLVWRFRVMYTIAFFASVLVINKCTLWDQFVKIFAGLSFVVAAFMGTTDLSVMQIFVGNMLMINIPTCIVGISLIFPPALAADSCARKVRKIQMHLGNIAKMYVYAVCHPNFANMYLFEAESTTAAVTPMIESLSALISSVEAEAMIFPPLAGMTDSLRAFLAAAKQILIEFESMRSAHSRAVFNTTHTYIMSVIEPGLKESLSSIVSTLDLSANCVALYPHSLWYKKFLNYTYWVSVRKSCLGRLSDAVECSLNSYLCRICSDDTPSADDQEQGASGENHTQRPTNYMSVLIALSQGRASAVDHDKDNSAPDEGSSNMSSYSIFNGSEPIESFKSSREEALANLHEECKIIKDIRQTLVSDIKLARERYLFRTDNTPFSSTVGEYEGDQGVCCPDISTTIRNEYLTLGVRNLVPRGAFLLHVVFVVNELIALEANLATVSYSVGVSTDSAIQGTSKFNAAALKSMYIAYEYTASCMLAVFSILREVLYSYLLPAYSGEKGGSPFKIYIKGLFIGYMQPFKIALAGTLCALLVIVPSWQRSTPNGSWAALVVMIVRQDTSSSSYLRGHQRLEGTVIGAIFSFVLIRIFNGIHDNRAAYDTVLFISLVLWVALCAYYREAETHGYSAAVAALTPVILIFSNLDDPNVESTAWARVAMTFYGVMVYLLIDNTIYPTRSDSLVRSGTASLISDIRKTALGCKDALRELFLVVQSPSEPRSRGGSTASIGPPELLDSPGSFNRDNEGDMAKIRLARAGSFDSCAWGSNATEAGDNVAESQVVLQVSYSSLQRYARCRHLIQDQVFALISSLSTKLNVRRKQILLTSHEPKLWHKAFPQAAYQRLQTASERVECALEAVSSSILYLCTTLVAMPVTDERETSSVAYENLSLVDGMSKSLLEVSDIADVALENVVSNITRIDGGHQLHKTEVDVTSMVNLSHHCEVLMDKINADFRVYYLLQVPGGDIRLNRSGSVADSPSSSTRKRSLVTEKPSITSSQSSRRLKIAAEDHYTDFILSWHAIVDSVYQLNKALADVGLALHNILAAETAPHLS